MKDRIVLLGPPATGKGTQASLLSSTFGIPAVSTGAMLREQMGKDPQLAASAWIKEGKLAPDDVVLKVVWAWLGSRSRFIMDGFPRTLNQAEAFEEALNARSMPLRVVYFFELPREVIRDRLLGRLTCVNCGAVYNVSFHQLKKGQACPACSGHLHRRQDDTVEALDQRLALYDEYTTPLIDFYEERETLKRIDATPGRDAVFKALYEDIRSAA